MPERDSKPGGRVSLQNVNHPGRTSHVDVAKYHAMHEALLEVLPAKAPGLTQAEFQVAVVRHLPQELFPGGAKAGWWSKAVHLDLEAKGSSCGSARRPCAAGTAPPSEPVGVPVSDQDRALASYRMKRSRQMAIRLKPLDEQVMVITGASSGIGLTTARMAAGKGVRLVLAARNDDALAQLVDEIRGAGGEAVHVAADVGSEDDVRRIADAAVQAFGGFDTWVNNAGVSTYGRTDGVPVDDMRRVFETNFWGVVYGSRAAVEHLRERGGAIINIGSELSDVAAPLQGIYSASKHAVKGWTDAMRMELQDEGAPISVTLKPAAIDTPYAEHAGNEMADHPKHVPPVYAPESVAEAILGAATQPTRDTFVGSAGLVVSTLNRIAPGLADRIVRRVLIPGTHSGEPPRGRTALHDAGDDSLRERGDYPGVVRPSLYTAAKVRPVVAGAAALGAGVLAARLRRMRRD